LPELALIEGNQSVATKPDESLSPSLFTVCSTFATIHRNYYCVFMTAGRESRSGFDLVERRFWTARSVSRLSEILTWTKSTRDFVQRLTGQHPSI
jgi:hypothetical protein